MRYTTLPRSTAVTIGLRHTLSPSSVSPRRPSSAASSPRVGAVIGLRHIATSLQAVHRSLYRAALVSGLFSTITEQVTGRCLLEWFPAKNCQGGVNAGLNLDHSSVSATEAASFEGARLQPCHYVCVGSWASAPEGTRTSSQHRSPSVAKAIIMTADCGTAEAVPFQSARSMQLKARTTHATFTLEFFQRRSAQDKPTKSVLLAIIRYKLRCSLCSSSWPWNLPSCSSPRQPSKPRPPSKSSSALQLPCAMPSCALSGTRSASSLLLRMNFPSRCSANSRRIPEWWPIQLPTRWCTQPQGRRRPSPELPARVRSAWMSATNA